MACLGCLQLTIGAVRAKSAKSVALKVGTVHLQTLWDQLSFNKCCKHSRCPLLGLPLQLLCRPAQDC